MQTIQHPLLTDAADFVIRNTRFNDLEVRINLSQRFSIDDAIFLKGCSPKYVLVG